jgi:hypothetical protein
MVGIARVCPLFTKMVDSLSPISSDTAFALKSAGGVGAVARYLDNLSPHERDNIFAAGLGILPMSEAPGGPLDGAVGRARSAFLRQRAALLGVPRTVHLMIDLEGQRGSFVDVTAYATALAGDLALAGYIPLAYVGAGQILSGAELYALESVHLYWRAGSLGIPEPKCGFAIWQIPPLDQLLAGMRVDVSLTGADQQGRQPILWWPN